MEKLSLFAIRHNTDQTEGRGGFHTLYHARNQEIAERIISLPAFYKNYGVQGQSGAGIHVALQEIKILESIEDFLMAEGNRETLDALDKLTPRQRELLGLSSFCQ